MRKNLKNVLVITLVTGLFLSVVGIAAADEPTVGEVTVSPEEPTRESTVTFSVDVTGDDIEEVHIKVEECVGTDPSEPNYFCYAGLLNVSLTNVDGTWEGTGTLQYDDVDVGHCWPVVKSNGTWYDFKNDRTTWTNFTIVAEDNGNDNGGDGGDGKDKTPGFELILVIFSIVVVALLIYKKKRT